MENAAVVKRLAIIELKLRMDKEKRAGKLAKGTRGQLRGKKAGTSKGRGNTEPVFSGGVAEAPPEKTLEDYGIDKTLAKQIRKVGDLTPEQVEQDVARVPRLAVASIEDGSDHVIRGQDIEKATVLDIVSDGGW